MSYRFLSLLITILLAGVFPAGGSLWAKEDTAYLTFLKSAPSQQGITVYTVKKGERLFDIVRRVTGETKHRIPIISKYNPGIKDFNRIYPGQKIFLPSKAKTSATSPEISPITAPPAPPQPVGMLKDDMAYPSQIKWTLVKDVLGQIGATVTTQGKYYLPLRDVGQITIDCKKIPMVEFADRGIVFIDFRNQIPDNLRQIVRRTWKHYSIIKVNPKSEAPVLLEQIIQASNTHAMIRQERPLNIGTQPILQIPASWTITRKSSLPASHPYAIALWLRMERADGLSEPVKAYAESKGWKIIEVVQEKIVKQTADESVLSKPVSKFLSTSLIDIADECFRRLGLKTQKNSELKIFDSTSNGFDLRIEVDLLVSSGDRRLILLSKNLPNQFLNILKSNRTEVVLAIEGETKQSILEKSFKAMHIPYEFNTFSFPSPDKTEGKGTYIIFPALKVSMDKGKVQYLIDFDLDERLNGFLSEKMGILVLKY